MAADIQFSTYDAFADAGEGEAGVSSEEKVHVRVQQRNGRKCITTVAGLADDLDVKRICKAFKKNFSCNGAVQKDAEVGEVIQLSDAFVDAGEGKAGSLSLSSGQKAHVKLQGRNGKISIRIIAGSADNSDVRRILKASKKNLNCNGVIQKDREVGEVIQLTGDQRTNLKEFLLDQGVCRGQSNALYGF